ncbi:hypothetical protein [Falsiroseomonas sp.]|uniref:hypothetical protein n=1 Tax=Falsiroseomonas sp. TaxID=2870721 RepID=UPI003F6E7658
MPLTGPRNTQELNAARRFRFTVAASVRIFPGALAMLNASGLLTPGAVATGQTAAGRALTDSNDGPVTVERGVFKWKNSASADAITAADWGKQVFIVDDETVAKTNGSSTRSAAGICRGVDADGVWVET